jgi:hypothetical protein
MSRVREVFNNIASDPAVDRECERKALPLSRFHAGRQVEVKRKASQNRLNLPNLSIYGCLGQLSVKRSAWLGLYRQSEHSDHKAQLTSTQPK